jgi:hydrogenase expression/formation protein HypC
VCLAVPGRIQEVGDDAGLRVAVVDFCGVRKRVCLETLPEAVPGDWVIVHAGFALQRLDAVAAEEVRGWLGAGGEGAP